MDPIADRARAQVRSVVRCSGVWDLWCCSACYLHLPLPIEAPCRCEYCGCVVLRLIEEAPRLAAVLLLAEGGYEWRP